MPEPFVQERRQLPVSALASDLHGKIVDRGQHELITFRRLKHYIFLTGYFQKLPHFLRSLLNLDSFHGECSSPRK